MAEKVLKDTTADLTEDQSNGPVGDQSEGDTTDNVTDIAKAAKKKPASKAKTDEKDGEEAKPKTPRTNINEDALRNVVGKRIKALREDRGYTQKTFSDAIRAKAGACSRQAVAQWERGAATPSNGMLIVLARILRTTASYIAFGDKGANSAAAQARSKVVSDLVMVQEVTFGESPTDRTSIRKWGLPKDVVSEITNNKADDLFITQVVGDAISENYPAHSRVYVDAKDLRPDGSPMGFWDGFGIAFAYISPVFGQANTLRLQGKGLDETMESKDVVLMGKVKRSA